MKLLIPFLLLLMACDPRRPAALLQDETNQIQTASTVIDAESLATADSEQILLKDNLIPSGYVMHFTRSKRFYLAELFNGQEGHKFLEGRWRMDDGQVVVPGLGKGVFMKATVEQNGNAIVYGCLNFPKRDLESAAYAELKDLVQREDLRSTTSAIVFCRTL